MSNRKRIVITGATGLIGRKLAEALMQRGDQVVVFSRSPDTARAKLPGAADYVAWTPSESGAWFSAIDGADAVIHLAGESISEGLFGKRWTDEQKRAILESREIGTRGIVAAIAAAEQRPETLICASGIGYYGHRDATALGEDAAAADDFVAQVCVAWEREAAAAEEHGVRVVRVRTGLVLDANSGVLPQIMLPFKLFTGGPVLPGSQYYSWIHLADLIGIYLLGLDDERAHGPINATAPEPLTNREFSSVLGKVMGSPAWMPVPAAALRVALGEMADLVTTGQRVLPKKP